MKHFYFKYLKENVGIERLISFYGEKSVYGLVGTIFPVSIYFGKWTANELDLGLEQSSNRQSHEQIK
ncbi:hypothetical protein, partial [Salinivibrio sp. AR640]|uniref:hypothetical protein n=1 Tax=Salinivibrio sp. AR640 TaxID=1909437 RepID=UPI001A7E7D64